MNQVPDPTQSAAPADDDGGRPLDQLPRHAHATVLAVDANDEDLHRLMAMGVCEGHPIELVQTGDPLILRVLGARIGLSARLAQRIRVRPHEKGTA